MGVRASYKASAESVPLFAFGTVDQKKQDRSHQRAWSRHADLGQVTVAGHGRASHRHLSSFYSLRSCQYDNRFEEAFSFKQRLVLRMCIPDRLIVLSEDSKEFLELQCSALKSSVLKIYGGIDDLYFRPPSEVERQAARTRLDLQNDDILCLLVGRTTWNKGHDLLIRAARQIRQQHPDLQMNYYFVGTGGESKEIKKFAFAGDQDRKEFKFFGYVEDLRQMLWAADMFILPSRLEGFALAVAEAMSTGVVPIRTPSGGARDQIVDGDTGFIVPFEDPEALRAAIVKLTDADRRQEMARKSISRARACFSKQTMARKVLKS